MNRYLYISIIILLLSPTSAFAFPAPEAMGAISFALSSLWAHLSAIIGSIFGVTSAKKESTESLKKFFLAISLLFLASIALNFVQLYLSANKNSVANEVNFQKVQPVPYPEVRRTFSDSEHLYKTTVEDYLSNINQYQIIPVITLKTYESSNNSNHEIDQSNSLIINSHGEALNRPAINSDKTPLLSDWNNDLSRIAINSLINNDSKHYRWLEGGYRDLINSLSEKNLDGVKYIDPEQLHKYEEDHNALFIDVSEKHAYDERGYFYSAINLPYDQIFSQNLSVISDAKSDIPIVFLDFYERKSKAVANWYYLKTGNQSYILDGGYENLTEKQLDWVPFYPNRYRLLSPSQIYDWFVGTNDVVFLDGRSSEQYMASEEKWISISTPIEYENLQDLYSKVDGLDKSKRYVGFVYDQGNAFKTLVLGHALHERGYTWLGLYTRPQHLSYAELDDFMKNRPYRIERWQAYVRFMESYPKYLSYLYGAFNISGWLFLLAYGFLFRLALIPVTLWTSQPFFRKKPIKPLTKMVSNIVFISLLILFAVFIQGWMHNFGDLHWSKAPYVNAHLLDISFSVCLLATGLIGVQLAVTPGLRLFASRSKRLFGAISLLVVGYFLSGLTNGLLLYIAGVTLGSIFLSASEMLIRKLRKPVHSDDLPVLVSGKSTPVMLPCASETNEKAYGVKAGRLGESFQNGLPVPRFFVLTADAYESLCYIRNHRIVYESAKRFGIRVIVRSAALTEDASINNIGRFESKIADLSVMNHADFFSLISELWQNQHDVSPEKRQLIVQEFVDAKSYCVGVSRDIENPDCSRIEYGSHESVTEGLKVNSHLIADKDVDGGPFSEMHTILRALEKKYRHAIDAEFSVDRDKLHVLQVRPHHAFDLLNPVAAETLTNELKGIRNRTGLMQVHEVGDEPSFLSMSLLKTLYGESVISFSGLPFLISSGKRQKLMTVNQYAESLTETSGAIKVAYETVCSIDFAIITDETLIEHFKRLIELLESTKSLSIQLRIAKRLQTKISERFADGMGYWSEDQKDLGHPCHHPSVFLSESDFNINFDRISSYKGTGKAIPSLSPKIDKATRVMTDIHYLTARLYTGLSMITYEIDQRIQNRFNVSPGFVLGATVDEIIGLNWNNSLLWDARTKALKECQNTSGSTGDHSPYELLEEPLEAVVFHVNADTDLDTIPDNALLVMNNGRSDIIHKMDSLKGILCKNGGENSHWMMVARSLGVYAISGDRQLSLEEWAHLAPVTIIPLPNN